MDLNVRAKIIKLFSSVQSLSRVRLFATPWIAAPQASLSITNSQSSLRLTSIKSVMPSSHLILCRPLLLLPPVPPSIRSIPVSQLFSWGGQSTGVLALASFLPKKSQGWSPSEWTGWISLKLLGNKNRSTFSWPWIQWWFLYMASKAQATKEKLTSWKLKTFILPKTSSTK